MTVTAEQREKILADFHIKWPLSALQNLTLEQYICLGDKNTLAYWLEFGEGRFLGSIKGGDASKFGIYERKAEAKGERGFISSDSRYSWKNKYGHTAEEAFAAIKAHILAIAHAAQTGDTETIENLDFEVALKWKLAFLYQDHAHPCVLSIYKLQALQSLLPGNRYLTHSEAYRKLLAERGNKSLIEYGLALWKESEAEKDDDRPQSLDDITVDEGKTAVDQPVTALNQILYGPPGTGKTWNTVNHALTILDPVFLDAHRDERHLLKARFDELADAGHIDFVTFHQSFSYEDFVEGIRADIEEDATDEGSQLKYRIEDGIFKKACIQARRDRSAEIKLGIDETPQVWKLSIEEVNSSGYTRDYCFRHNEARIGWGHVGDLRSANLNASEHKLGPQDRNSLTYFSQTAKEGDIILCLASQTEICAMGVVTGSYFYQEDVPQGVREDYQHVLPVNWLLKDIRYDIRKQNGDCMLRPKTMYPLRRIVASDLLNDLRDVGFNLAESQKTAPAPHVLIIDEINRGNISRIFGELITLIETSKRQGQSEALSVTLPYSKKRFSVPGNLYIIGTMNTADRSLSGLDIALRRRFTFVEMLPQPERLDNVVIYHEEGDINVGDLLRVINQRIEVLLDRDHCLGHAYFMPLQAVPTLQTLASIFKNQVLPLLQEYFFEDWQRINWVLNGHHSDNRTPRFICPPKESQSLEKLFGKEVAAELTDRRWQFNEAAFMCLESYRLILREAE
ncbi:AAA family ATPase [Phytobacter diazotrophicus]|uniref:AAA family ATPase n=1 Tax=Citrobacter bitternis TaxID=1585982 RepID=A0ABW1Q2K5_9ENTR|nr:AAA family ATPase [Phytobacter diazotrophicus]MDU7134012.1 AAA family ATPase [Enterobacteriaceae bacterium]PTA97448.1 AAA family ATPase [Kluyvera sp. Nf5]QIH64733.1 AAA family ATPase [Enterobacteriaceae bacterium A-F18]SLK14083.1 5-methylcytosine-specific restriction enzyme B [Enterobacter sp. NFR05]